MTPLEIGLAIALALAIFACAALTRDRYRYRAERDVARARLQDQAEGRMQFEALASQALRRSNAEFLKLADQTLKRGRGEAAAEIERRRNAIDQLITPIRSALEKTASEIEKVERGQLTLNETVRSMNRTHSGLRQETQRLAQALRRPNVRGRYGEVQLRRVVELSGMRDYCDFEEQSVIAEGKQRPDVVVRMPNGRFLAIDAKISIDAYLDAFEEEDGAARERLLDRYAEDVLLQAQRLGRKSHWESFESSPELVVLFIPGDQLVDAALARKPKLVELAAEMNLVIASPSTLIGLLRAVHVGWREKGLSDRAKELFQLGRELHDRAVTTFGYAAKVGESLRKAQGAYNSFVGSFEARVLPTLRKFEEGGARSGKTLSSPAKLEGQVRDPRSGEKSDVIPPPPPPELLVEEDAE